MNSPLSKFITFVLNVLKTKAVASNEDNPNYWEAMNGPFANKYWKPATKEFHSLEDMGGCDVIDETPEMNVINST